MGGGGGCPDQLNPKCQDLSKSAFGGGGGVVQTNSTQSAKICPNLRGGGGYSRSTQPKVPRSVQIFGGGGVVPDQLSPKCQDLSKSEFGGGGGGMF